MAKLADYACRLPHEIKDWERCAVCQGLGVIGQQLQQHFGIKRSDRTEGPVWDGSTLRCDNKLRHPGVTWHEMTHWLLIPASRQILVNYGFGTVLPFEPPTEPCVSKAVLRHEEWLVTQLAPAMQRLWLPTDSLPSSPPLVLGNAYASHLVPRLKSHPVLATLEIHVGYGTLDQWSPELEPVTVLADES